MRAIISYDDTPADQDALALGGLLAAAGAGLTLAYVRHATLADPIRDGFDTLDTHALLEHGADSLGELDVECRVVLHPSTEVGLARLATAQEADLVVFGSGYRTAAGHVSLGRPAERLLEHGHIGLAIAPAAYRTRPDRPIRTVGVLPAGDPAVLESAEALCDRFEARIAGTGGEVDLLLVGSRPEAPLGRLMVSAQYRNELERAACPVIILARATPLRFARALA